MKKVTDLNAVLEKISETLASCMTNGILGRDVLEREAADGTLFSEETGSGIFLLRRRSGFSRMNFCVKAVEELHRFRPCERTVTEIPYRMSAGNPLAEALESAGWNTILERVRLRRAASSAEEGASFPYCDISPSEAFRLLESCFSPLTGCLPTEKELEDDIAEKRLLYKDGGLLRYFEKGNFTEIRHLAVLSENRGRGVADSLLECYLSRNGNRASRVWTGSGNTPALHLYEKAGYLRDGWRSSVLVIEP